MISYQGDLDLRDLIASLGRVYAVPIDRSRELLEDLQILYESLFEEYQQENDSLQLLLSSIIRDNKMYGVNLDRATVARVAAGGHLEVLRVLRDGSLGRVYSWDEHTTEHAASGGYLEVLRALRDGSLGGVCPWNGWVTTNAMIGGHVEILRALRDGSLGSKCPWSKLYYPCLVMSPPMIELINSGELD